MVRSGGGEVDVEHLVEAEHTERREHFALGIGAYGVAELFADSGADGGRGRHNDHLFGVGYRFAHVVDLLALVQRARRAHRDALTAGDAGNVREVAFERAADMRLESAAAGRDDRDLLHALARGYAAAAENTFFIVAHEIGGGVVGFGQVALALESGGVAAVFVGKRLQFAVGAAHARQAFLFMVGH